MTDLFDLRTLVLTEHLMVCLVMLLTHQEFQIAVMT
jgi:hypothetical protein